MPVRDVPEQHPVAIAVIRRLGEGARAGDGATAVVEPVPHDVPVRRIRHETLRNRRNSLRIVLDCCRHEHRLCSCAGRRKRERDRAAATDDPSCNPESELRKKWRDRIVLSGRRSPLRRKNTVLRRICPGKTVIRTGYSDKEKINRQPEFHFLAVRFQKTAIFSNLSNKSKLDSNTVQYKTVLHALAVAPIELNGELASRLGQELEHVRQQPTLQVPVQ